MKIVDLQRGDLLSFSAASGHRIQVLFGQIWLTEPGRLDDVFASQGESVTLQSRGRVLVESSGFARVAMTPAANGPLRSATLTSLRRFGRGWLPAGRFTAGATATA